MACVASSMYSLLSVQLKIMPGGAQRIDRRPSNPLPSKARDAECNNGTQLIHKKMAASCSPPHPPGFRTGQSPGQTGHFCRAVADNQPLSKTAQKPHDCPVSSPCRALARRHSCSRAGPGLPPRFGRRGRRPVQPPGARFICPAVRRQRPLPRPVPGAPGHPRPDRPLVAPARRASRRVPGLLYSVAALQTEDLGVRRGAGFELAGRAALAEARGCSLLAAA